MIKMRITVYYEPLIGGMDRAIEILESVHPLSLSSLKLALYLTDDKTKSLTIPENDGKVYTVELKRRQ